MGNKEEFLKIKINDIANSYKAAAALSSAALAADDIKLAKELHKKLKNIFSKLKDTVYMYGDSEITEKIKNDDFENLPEWLESVKTADYGRKLLALKYANKDCDNVEDKIMINKMAIELNPQEDIPYITIARTLFEAGHPLQALELYDYIKTFAENTLPILSLAGEIYRGLGMYAESIEAYVNILDLDDGNEEIQARLEEICEEVLTGNG